MREGVGNTGTPDMVAYEKSALPFKVCLRSTVHILPHIRGVPTLHTRTRIKNDIRTRNLTNTK